MIERAAFRLKTLWNALVLAQFHSFKCMNLWEG